MTDVHQESNIDFKKLEESLRLTLQDLKGIRLKRSRIKTGKKLDGPSSADVFIATLETRRWYQWSRKEDVVVKQIKAEGNDKEPIRIVVALARELRVWSTFNHTNVLRLRGFYCDEVRFTYACAVTELQENGNLLQYIAAKNPDINRLLALIKGTASGLAYIHSKNVCHGDVKPENTLVGRAGEALICDFGLSKELNNDHTGLTTTSGPLTVRYASPEALSAPTTRSLPSDVWSFGCLIYRLLSRHNPWQVLQDKGSIIDAIGERYTPNHPEPYPSVPGILPSNAVEVFLKSCWSFEPAGRPQMGECELTVSGWAETRAKPT